MGGTPNLDPRTVRAELDVVRGLPPPRVGALRRLGREGILSGGVRERAVRALDDDWTQVLAALRRGLEDKDAGKAARTAVAYVQLVYGRQLQPANAQRPHRTMIFRLFWPLFGAASRTRMLAKPLL
jgi:hypothetical protein